MVRILVAKSEQSVTAADRYKRLPIHLAAFSGQLSVVLMWNFMEVEFCVEKT